MSQACYALKDYRLAIKHIRSALSSEPDNVIYLNQLGISYKESQQFEDATKVYNSIIKLDPENKAALYNKAVLMNTLGKPEEALKILDRLLMKDPEFGPAKTKKQEIDAAMKSATAPAAS